MDLSLRQATLSDADAVAELFNQYRVWYGETSDPQGARKFVRERISKNESVIFIAFSGNVAAGFTQLYPSFSSVRMKRIWVLNDLFVKPEFRGKGFSKALLDRAKRLCGETNAGGFMLETAKDNDIGNILYPAAGMELNTTCNFYNWNVS